MATKLKPGTFVVVTREWNGMRKGSILQIIKSISSESQSHYHYKVKTIKINGNPLYPDRICGHEIKVLKGYGLTKKELKAFHLKEIEEHIKIMWKRQHYYKIYIAGKKKHV